MKILTIALGFVLVASIWTAPDLFAQSLELDLGVRGGVFTQPPPIEADSSHYFPSSFDVDRTRSSIGPGLGVVAFDRVEIRFEAVRSTFAFRSSAVFGPDSSTTTTKGYLWQYPLLGTYQFGSGLVRPFAGGGMSFVHSIHGSTVGTEVEQIPGQPPRMISLSEPYRPFSNPLVLYISGGVNARTSHFLIRPEVRYGRWSQLVQEEDTLNLTGRNQFEFLIGFSWRAIRVK